MVESAVHWLMSYLAIPEIGLTSVFIICFVSATLLPMGSEPAVFAVIASSPSMSEIAFLALCLVYDHRQIYTLSFNDLVIVVHSQ